MKLSPVTLEELDYIADTCDPELADIEPEELESSAKLLSEVETARTTGKLSPALCERLEDTLHSMESFGTKRADPEYKSLRADLANAGYFEVYVPPGPDHYVSHAPRTFTHRGVKYIG